MIRESVSVRGGAYYVAYGAANRGRRGGVGGDGRGWWFSSGVVRQKATGCGVSRGPTRPARLGGMVLGGVPRRGMAWQGRFVGGSRADAPAQRST